MIKNIKQAFVKYADMIAMCEGTPLAETPFQCVRLEGGKNLTDHPDFKILDLNKVQFAIAVVDGKPAYEGAKVYSVNTGKQYELKEDPSMNDQPKTGIHYVNVALSDDEFTWKKPAKPLDPNKQVNNVVKPQLVEITPDGIKVDGKLYVPAQ